MYSWTGDGKEGGRDGWKEGAQVTTHTGVEELCYLHVEERENCWSR